MVDVLVKRLLSLSPDEDLDAPAATPAEAEAPAAAAAAAVDVASSGTGFPPWWVSATTFDTAVRARHASSGARVEPCVLDVSVDVIHNYARGHFGYVEQRLMTALGAPATALSMLVLRQAGVAIAFELRRELVAFKKALLFVFHDAQKLEADLMRMELFFYRDRECDRHRHRPSEDAAAYARACFHRQRTKGLLLAVHDARGLLKLLCLLPRHPDLEDAEIDPRLRAMTFGASAALAKAEAFLATVEGGAGQTIKEAKEVEDEVKVEVLEVLEVLEGETDGDGAAALAARHTDKTLNKTRTAEAVAPLPSGFMRRGVDELMALHRAMLPSWPPHVTALVEKTLIAHGGSKAISIRDGFVGYRRALYAVHVRTCRVVRMLERLKRRTEAALARCVEGLEEARGASDAIEGTRRAVGGGATSGKAGEEAVGGGATSGKAGEEAVGGGATSGKAGEEAVGGGPTSGKAGEEAAKGGEAAVGEAAVGEVAASGPKATAADSIELITLRSREVHVTKHLNLLSGVREANALLLAMTRLLKTAPGAVTTSTAKQPADEKPADEDEGAAEQLRRCFVAGDGARGVRSLFVPPEFAALCSLLTVADAAARDMAGMMHDTIAIEGWPPPLCARRTRVQTGGVLACHSCNRRFSKHWSFSGVCWECEGAIRARGACPYDSTARSNRDGRAASTHAFCVHQSKCAVCDGGFLPCPLCRLARGDGERCVEICAEIGLETGFETGFETGERGNGRDGSGGGTGGGGMGGGGTGGGGTGSGLVGVGGGGRVTAVFLDFDRTLCSTKAGRSPLSGLHQVDHELASLCTTYPVYVVTRNPHEAEIVTFLEQRGVAVARVCVVPKRASKADVMVQVLPSLKLTSQLAQASPHEGHADDAARAPTRVTPVQALFVDDDVRELMRPSVAELPGLLRVLFRRTGP